MNSQISQNDIIDYIIEVYNLKNIINTEVIFINTVDLYCRVKFTLINDFQIFYIFEKKQTIYPCSDNIIYKNIMLRDLIINNILK